MPFNLLVLACVVYVGLLFVLAFMADARAEAGWRGLLHSPWVYTLSLSIYCTAWTFYGAVGYAARSGLEFLTIYLGPTLVFVGWWGLLRKLVAVGRRQQVTSIADLLSSRYGKSNATGVIVTLIAVVATTPYIALQLQSVALSFAAFAQSQPEGWALPNRDAIALWVAAGLALFTVLFGTRNLDAKEQHPGVVIAIAVEAVVKLVALVAVGIFVVWGLAGGPAGMLAHIDASPIADWQIVPSRWAGLIGLSAMAVVTLPRMFQIMVVEAGETGHLARAAWAFPAYLFAMSLFILPIAVMGLERLPAGSNPDMFVLSLPLAEGQGGLAALAFLGGFSSASSMVIVESMALATMLSNHVLMPAYFALNPDRRVTGDLRGPVLMLRRLAILVVVGLGYGYYRMSGGTSQLASMGLIAFAGVAQVLPALLGGLYWRGATRSGAIAGLVTGLAIWAFTLFLPSFGPGGALPDAVLRHGLWGLSWLRPEALFGVSGLDPLIHALFWSLALNAALFGLVSILTFPSPVERLQGAAFVLALDKEPREADAGWARGSPQPEVLLEMAQRILGREVALGFFQAAARDQGKTGYLPDMTGGFLDGLERRLAGSVGAATAHAMMSQAMGRVTVTVEDLMAVASESAQIIEYSARLEAQQGELTRTARALREANDKLSALSVQKDAFLSQISHELRTPMTSIRAFSELLAEGDLPPEKVAEFGRILYAEAVRLTRLLDDLLDLSVLERGSVQLTLSLVHLGQMIDKALVAAGQTRPDRDITVHRDPVEEDIYLKTDADRLVQVLINLISNARKYCNAARPELTIAVRRRAGRVFVDVIDNGSGIPADKQAIIFEKFARATDDMKAGGAGLGLAICREILGNLGGSIAYLPGQKGAAFRVTLPLRHDPDRARLAAAQ
jgi:Na+/proline symporter/nitrogen-specific signal transduction histidine kinase